VRKQALQDDEDTTSEKPVKPVVKKELDTDTISVPKIKKLSAFNLREAKKNLAHNIAK
jgi:hypothetical protein